VFENDKIFIELLKFASKKGLDGATVSELDAWAGQNEFIAGSAANAEQTRDALRQLFLECTNPVENSDVRVLRNEYYFRLIEYNELRESRIAARVASEKALIANDNAVKAIRIAVVAIIVSVLATIFQITTPVTINKTDLDAMVNGTKDAEVQKEVKLDSLQMAQILSAIGYGQSMPKQPPPKATDQGKEISHHELINRYFEEE
jgi:hypothetical protein